MTQRKSVLLLLSCVLTLGCLMVCQAEDSVAYIGYYDLRGANDFRELLDGAGYSMTLVQLCDVAATDLSSFDLLIVGGDTGNFAHWGNDAGVEKVRVSGLPILGIYTGGGSLFDRLGAGIGWWYAAFISASLEPTSMVVSDASHVLFHTPNEIAVSDDGRIQVYESCAVMCQHIGSLSEEVHVLGKVARDPDYGALVEHGEYVLWTYEGSPSKMTPAGKDLFLNVLAYLLADR